MSKIESGYLDEALKNPEFKSAFVAETLKTDVSEELAKLLRRTGVTQAELSRRIGVSRARVHQILRGQGNNFTLDLIGRCAGALEMRWTVALAPLVDSSDCEAKANAADGFGKLIQFYQNDPSSTEESVRYQGRFQPVPNIVVSASDMKPYVNLRPLMESTAGSA